MKKGQVANEFIIMVGISIIFITIFIAAQASEFQTLAINKETEIVQDYGLGLQKEFFIAANVRDGYIREIFLPDTIHGINYVITNDNNSIYIRTTEKNIEFNFIIPTVVGGIHKGTNKINKTGGVIYLQ